MKQRSGNYRELQHRLSFCSNRKLPKSVHSTKIKETYSEDPHLFPKSFSIGSIAGFLGSLAGMGGGFIIIPLLTATNSTFFHKLGIKGVSQHLAHGTSLFAVCATGISGAMGFGLQDLHLESVGALSLTGMITARMGALFIHKLNQKQLQLGLGVFMICVAPLVPLKPYIASKFGENQKNIMDQGEKVETNKNTKIINKGAKSPTLTPLDHAKEQMKTKSATEGYSFNDRIILPGFVGLGSGFISGLFGVGGRLDNFKVIYDGILNSIHRAITFIL